MSAFNVLVIEPNTFVATVLCSQLQRLGCTGTVIDPLQMEALVAAGGVHLIAISADVMARDQHGRERPFWHILAMRSGLPVPVLCYSGNSQSSAETPLFTAPPGTMLVGSPQDFQVLATIIQRHCALFTRHVGLADALAGRCLPALSGNFAEFNFDAVLKLFQLNDHSGVLLLRHGLHAGILAIEQGEVVHALVGSLMGRDAFCELFRWETADFVFLRGMLLGERSVQENLDSLLLEAISTGDEANDMLSTLISLQSYVQRVRGYTDQLQNQRLTPIELKVLWMVDRFHIVNDLIRSVDGSSVMALKALRKLILAGLVEVLPLQQPTVRGR